MRTWLCVAAVLGLLAATSAAAVSELEALPGPEPETALLETGETVLVGCWREAKKLCAQQKERCRQECYQLDDMLKGSEGSGSQSALLEADAAIPEIVPKITPKDGLKPCAGNKCSSLFQSCYKVHSEACGFRKQDHIQWSNLKDVNSKAEAHRNKCIQKLRNKCRKHRVRCEKECLEDKADLKSLGASPEEACDPAKCKSEYVACRESTQVAERLNCAQSLVKPQSVPGLFECRDPDNCKTPWQKPKSGCSDDSCPQQPSVSDVSSCEGCDKARILCYDECGGKIDGSCDIKKRDCQRDHRKCHYTCPWKPALSIDQADGAGKGGKPLLRAKVVGSAKNCGCLGNDEECLKKSPCYDPNAVNPVMVPRGTLPQPGLAGQSDGLMAASVRAGKARRDQERADEAKAKADDRARVDRLRKWRKQRTQDAKSLADLKAAAGRRAAALNRKAWAAKTGKSPRLAQQQGEEAQAEGAEAAGEEEPEGAAEDE